MDAVELELAPPASAEEITRVEAELGFRLPRELRDVLAVTRGLQGPLGPIEDLEFLPDPGAIEVPGLPGATVSMRSCTRRSAP